MATKWAIIHILIRLDQKVIDQGLSWSSKFSSANSTIVWKFIIEVKTLESVTIQTLKVSFLDYQMSLVTHMNLSFSKRY